MAEEKGWIYADMGRIVKGASLAYQRAVDAQAVKDVLIVFSGIEHLTVAQMLKLISEEYVIEGSSIYDATELSAETEENEDES